MLKLSSKRTHESLEGMLGQSTPIACSPHKIQFLDSPMKRFKGGGSTSPPSSSSTAHTLQPIPLTPTKSSFPPPTPIGMFSVEL